MSNGDYPLGAPTASDEASLFAGIMGGSDEPDHDQGNGEGDQGQGEGREPDGHEETEAERQDRERDAQGRFARPDPKGKGEQPQGQDRAQKGLRNAVTTERSARQAAEAKAEAVERQLGEMRAQMEMLARQQAMGARSQPQQPVQEKQEAAEPDMWTDPKGYRDFVIRQAEERAQSIVAERDNQRIRYSFEDAGQRHGDAFQAAYRALDGLPPDPANVATLNRIRAAADPGEALVNWHKAHQARQEIGADPVAYRERVKAEIADPQKLMQDPAFAAAVADLLRQQAGQGGSNGGPRTTYTPVPSLNGTRGSNARSASPDAYDNSDRGVFRDVMSGR